LYLDPKRKQWTIRDGARFVRLGIPECDRHRAEKRLAAYLGAKHQPESGPDPLIADVLLFYAQERVPHTKAQKNTAYTLASLANWWSAKRVSEISARACRAYGSDRLRAAARRDLECLRAAIGYWKKERGLALLPTIVLPPKPEARDRWLTKH